MTPRGPAQAAKDRLILALDVDTLDEARRLVEHLGDYVGVFKVGLQLFAREGPGIFDRLKAEGAANLFFDSKFMDIPNTVSQASRLVAGQGLFMFNVHASGGLSMLKAASAAAREAAQEKGCPRPRLLAVTVLTSIGQRELKEELGVARALEEQVIQLALLAKAAQLDGVVASPMELAKLRAACGPAFLLVTPGIRPSGSIADDQARIHTPQQAIKAGADYLVVGRPITAAADKREAARRIIGDMEEALSMLPPVVH